MEKPNPTLILIGSEEENFYQLGLKDKSFYQENKSSIFNLFGIQQSPLKTAVRTYLQGMANLLGKDNKEYENLCKAYAEGLNERPDQVIALFLIPELLSCSNKFLPSFARSLGRNLLGCSSIFYNDGNSLLHGRILDFPLCGILDNGMQEVLFQGEDYKIFANTFKGIPFPSLTALNDKGITLGLHQKFNNIFEIKGTPVFYIVFQILKYARDLKDIEEILNEYPSMTSWGINISANGLAYEIDLIGKDYSIIETEVIKGDFLYQCNEPIEKDHSEVYLDVFPHGMEEFNKLRRETFENLISNKKLNNEPNEEFIFKLMTTPMSLTTSNPLNPQTLASLDVVVMNGAKGENYRVYGSAPKNQEQPIFRFENVFDTPKFKIMNRKLELDQNFSNYYKGLKNFSRASLSFQESNYSALFHYIQLAENYVKNSHYYNYVRFYHLAYGYILFEENMMPFLMKEFLKIRNSVSPYINEHIELHLLRLHKIVDRSYKFEFQSPYSKFESEYLEEVFKLEEKMSPKILWSKRKFYMPRPEVNDIIYPLFS